MRLQPEVAAAAKPVVLAAVNTCAPSGVSIPRGAAGPADTGSGGVEGDHHRGHRVNVDKRRGWICLHHLGGICSLLGSRRGDRRICPILARE